MTTSPDFRCAQPPTTRPSTQMVGPMLPFRSKSRGVCFATFSGDLAPALLVLGAEIDLIGPSGRRTLPLQRLYIGHARHDGSTEGDGKTYLALRPGEFVQSRD